MPRRLTREMTFDTLESEAMFTLAALQADPNAADLVPLVSGWIDRIDEVRVFDRQLRQLEANADASRVISNQYLDSSCTRFGDELYLAAGKDRSSSRWTRFFSMPVSDFVRIGLARQVSIVKSWLSASTDAVLEQHRADLESWSAKCDQALLDTDVVTVRRRDVWEKREALAGGLTKERDALHRKLAERADMQDLGRGWADLFFRIETRNEKVTAEPAPSSSG